MEIGTGWLVSDAGAKSGSNNKVNPKTGNVDQPYDSLGT
jgi:hypothetical protein